MHRINRRRLIAACLCACTLFPFPYLKGVDVYEFQIITTVTLAEEPDDDQKRHITAALVEPTATVVENELGPNTVNRDGIVIQA